jgi:hypothetical protein
VVTVAAVLCCDLHAWVHISKHLFVCELTTPCWCYPHLQELAAWTHSILSGTAAPSSAPSTNGRANNGSASSNGKNGLSFSNGTAGTGSQEGAAQGLPAVTLIGCFDAGEFQHQVRHFVDSFHHHGARCSSILAHDGMHAVLCWLVCSVLAAGASSHHHPCC